LLASLWVVVATASAEPAADAKGEPDVVCPGVTSAPGVGVPEGAPEVKTAHCGCSKGYSQGGCAKCNGLVPPTPASEAKAAGAASGKKAACGCQGGRAGN